MLSDERPDMGLLFRCDSSTRWNDAESGTAPHRFGVVRPLTTAPLRRGQCPGGRRGPPTATATGPEAFAGLDNENGSSPPKQCKHI